MGDSILNHIVRVGTVTAVNNEKRLARVKFLDSGITSGWLAVLDNRPYIPDYEGPQRTEYESGGAGDAAFADHKHDLIIKPWMPKAGDTVLTLYLPVHDGDGFVLGRIHAWG